MAPRTLALPSVSTSITRRALADSLVNTAAQQFVELAPSKKERKKSTLTKDDPMIARTFTMRQSMLDAILELASTAQAESGAMNLSLYLRVILKRHIEKSETP